jgi:RNA polymerase sigma factor (sigma-70 family)
MSTTSRGTVRRLIGTLVARENRARVSDAELLERFITRRDEAAFTTLLHRHGPMVLGVCRRILRNEADAEDVFQGTFLLLTVRAERIQKPSSLASWLHGVAHRLATRTRAQARRRVQEEHRAAAERVTDSPVASAWQDLEEVLDDALASLPPRYRVPLVLCYLEGKTQEEVARLLGRPLGTVRSWLLRGRVLLRARLAHRGVRLSGGAVAAALLANSAGAGAATVSVRLVRATSMAARQWVLGQALDEVASASVAALCKSAGRAAVLAPLKIVTLLLCVIGAVTAGTGLYFSQDPVIPRAEERRTEADAPRSSAGPRLDPYGDPLPPEALSRLGTVRFRSGQFISWLAFTPDGKTLLSHGGKGDVSLWDAATGKEVGRISGEPGAPIHAAALSADGNRIATVEGSDSRMVSDVVLRLRDCATGKLARELGKGPYWSATFSPDGTLLAAARYDGRLDLWDVQAGQLLRGWKAHDHPTIIAWGVDDHLAWTARFTPDGKTLVTGHPLEGMRFWEVATGVQQRAWPARPQPGDAFALSPDGSVLAVGTRPAGQTAKATEPEFGRIHLLDLATGKELRQLSAAGEPPWGAFWGIRSVAFSPNGKKLAARGADGFLRVWDVASGKELKRWRTIVTVPRAVRFSPDSKTLAVTNGGVVRLLDVASGKEIGPSRENNGSMVAPVIFSTDGRTAITAGHSAPLLWDTATGRLLRRLEGHKESALVTTLTLAGNTLHSWADDSTLIAWDIRTGKELRRLPAAFDQVFPSFIPSPDGRVLAVTLQEKVVLLDAASGREVRRFAAHSGWVSSVAFTPDGQRLVTWGADGLARVWDLATAQERRQIPLVDVNVPQPAVIPPPGGQGARFFSARPSPDGRLLAFGSENHFLVIHELASGREVRRLDDLPDGVGVMAFSSDARTLAWAGKVDPTVRLVEVATGEERHHLTGHRGRVSSLAFSSDGRRLLSGSQDTTALVWDLTDSMEGKSTPLTADEREAYRADLVSQDATRAYRAVRRLASFPATLDGLLQPIDAVDEAHLSRLLRELDSDDFTRREKAAAELETLGEAAVPACRKALEGKASAEKRRRLQALLDRQAQVAWETSTAQLRRVRVLEALELSGTAEARQLLDRLARGLPGAPLTEEARAALGRLASQPAAR